MGARGGVVQAAGVRRAEVPTKEGMFQQNSPIIATSTWNSLRKVLLEEGPPRGRLAGDGATSWALFCAENDTDQLRRCDAI